MSGKIEGRRKRINQVGRVPRGICEKRDFRRIKEAGPLPWRQSFVGDTVRGRRKRGHENRRVHKPARKGHNPDGGWGGKSSRHSNRRVDLLHHGKKTRLWRFLSRGKQEKPYAKTAGKEKTRKG